MFGEWADGSMEHMARSSIGAEEMHRGDVGSVEADAEWGGMERADEMERGGM